MEHLSLIQTRVVTDRRRTLVKDQSYWHKKKKKKKRGVVKREGKRVQQYPHSFRYFLVCKTVSETAHKHFYCHVTWRCCIEGDRFIDFLANVCVEGQTWQSDLLWEALWTLPAPQECSGSVRTSRFLTVCVWGGVWERKWVHSQWNTAMSDAWGFTLFIAAYHFTWYMYTF